jgi:hypothetical protein
MVVRGCRLIFLLELGILKTINNKFSSVKKLFKVWINYFSLNVCIYLCSIVCGINSRETENRILSNNFWNLNISIAITQPRGHFLVSNVLIFPINLLSYNF